MAPPPETLRLLRLTGLLTWLLVAAPPAVEGVGRPAAFGAWLGAMALFGGLYAWATARGGKADPALWAARRERAKRWAGSDLKGYPSLGPDEETEETLAAEPPEPAKKKHTSQD